MPCVCVWVIERTRVFSYHFVTWMHPTLWAKLQQMNVLDCNSSASALMWTVSNDCCKFSWAARLWTLESWAHHVLLDNISQNAFHSHMKVGCLPWDWKKSSCVLRRLVCSHTLLTALIDCRRRHLSRVRVLIWGVWLHSWGVGERLHCFAPLLSKNRLSSNFGPLVSRVLNAWHH